MKSWRRITCRIIWHVTKVSVCWHEVWTWPVTLCRSVTCYSRALLRWPSRLLLTHIQIRPNQRTRPEGSSFSVGTGSMPKICAGVWRYTDGIPAYLILSWLSLILPRISWIGWFTFWSNSFFKNKTCLKCFFCCGQRKENQFASNRGVVVLRICTWN